MEVTDNNLLTLSDCLAQTLSPEFSVRRMAEEHLLSLERNQNYPILLIELIERDSIDLPIRLSASITLKNYIIRNWKIEDNQDKIYREDREIIKTRIVKLMTACTPVIVQKQLTVAVSFIGENDFPDNWPELLDEMKIKLAMGDIRVLRVAHSLFKRYRYEFKSQTLCEEMKFALVTCVDLITKVMTTTMEKVQKENEVELLPSFYRLFLICSKIFYSLNFQDLPDIFESNMSTWMEHFHVLLVNSPSSLISNDDDKSGLIEQVQSQICKNIIMYAQKYNEEFGPYAPRFLADTWNLLVGLGPQPKYDMLICNALRLLTTVAEQEQYQHLFNSPTVLRNICENVIVPNIQFRMSDAELFKYDPEEYIRRDMKGLDEYTRKRAACDLVKVLGKTYEKEISSCFSAYVKSMLETYASDPANWRCKNAAIFLVTSLAAPGQTLRVGDTINDFAKQFIMPELQIANVNRRRVIKVDCIRYIMTFRNVLAQELLLASFQNLEKFLEADNKVVLTYAAACIEKILCLRMPENAINSLKAMKDSLLNRCYSALREPRSAKNKYIMKTILRTICVLNDEAEKGPRTSASLIEDEKHKFGVFCELIVRLEALLKDPANPKFNHALFETIALCIKIGCKYNPAGVNAFESRLFPVFRIIPAENVCEFLPYFCQLFSMMFEMRLPDDVDPTPVFYLEFYKLLLTSPVLWEQIEDVNPLVGFMIEYTCKWDRFQIFTQLQSLLDVFQKLVNSEEHDHEGLRLLKYLLRKCPDLSVDSKKGIFSTLMKRLTHSKTVPVRYIRYLTEFLCHYVIFFGVNDLIRTLDQLQANLFLSVVEEVFLHENAAGSNPNDKKIMIVGLTDILCDSKLFLDGPNAKFGPVILTQIIKTLRSYESSDKKDEALLNSPTLYELIYTRHPSEDPLPSGIGNVAEYFCKKSSRHGEITNMIPSLSTEEQQMFKLYSVGLNVENVQTSPCSKRNIKLRSVDNVTFTVEYEAIRCSKVIRGMVELLGLEDNEEEAVSLPNVSADILLKVIQWASHHKDDPPLPAEDEQSEWVSSWDKDFLKLDNDILRGLIFAADYLDISGLSRVIRNAIPRLYYRLLTEENGPNDFFHVEVKDCREPPVRTPPCEASPHDESQSLDLLVAEALALEWLSSRDL